MHFSCYVFLDKGLLDGASDPMVAVTKAVEEKLRPYSEHEGDNGWWDWYQIGGRWTGAFDGYDPNSDDALLRVCQWCSGTGTRKDMVVANGCNGCGGTGKERLWATQWPLRSGDVSTVAAIAKACAPFRCVLKDGTTATYEPPYPDSLAADAWDKWHEARDAAEKEWHNGGYAAILATMDPHDIVVVVDYHS